MEENNLPPNENFYNLLGIENDADENAIKKAYRKKYCYVIQIKFQIIQKQKNYFNKLRKHA